MLPGGMGDDHRSAVLQGDASLPGQIAGHDHHWLASRRAGGSDGSTKQRFAAIRDKLFRSAEPGRTAGGKDHGGRLHQLD